MNLWNRRSGKTPKTWIMRLCLTIGLPYIMVLIFHVWFSRAPDHLGVRNGRLSPCPDSPNCVSTQTEEIEKQMPPLTFSGTADAAISQLKRIVLTVPRSKLVQEVDRYLHYEVRSLMFRFVDDVEFLIDDEAKVIHFRSASRVGRSDLGVNRHRMSQITDAWTRSP